jgi:hypothetical protein
MIAPHANKQHMSDAPGQNTATMYSPGVCNCTLIIKDPSEPALSATKLAREHLITQQHLQEILHQTNNQATHSEPKSGSKKLPSSRSCYSYVVEQKKLKL